jgi:hypothetical protein
MPSNEPFTTEERDPNRLIDTRSVIAFMALGTVGTLTLWLAWTRPESDEMKILIGVWSTMMAGIVGYYFGSSATGERKDRAQDRVTETLASKVSTGTGEGSDGKMRFVWWSLFSDEEKAKIEDAAKIDGRVKTFKEVAAAGRAHPDDLDYLVAVGVLTQERADMIRTY